MRQRDGRSGSASKPVRKSDLLFKPELITRREPVRSLQADERRLIASALEAAFIASLHANEGRPLEFVITVVPDARVFSGALKLERPEPLTPQTLRVLSAALDPEEQCFVVAPGLSGRLEIQAFSTRPDLFGLPTPPSPLVIVDGPGHVALMIKDKRLLYDRGQLRCEDGARLGEWVHETTELIVSHVSTPTPDGKALHLGIRSSCYCDPDRWKSNGNALKKQARSVAPALVEQVLRRIAKWAKEARHGGAFLLLPEGADPKAVASDDGGHWFRDGDQELKDSAFGLAALQSHLRLARQGKWVLDIDEKFQEDLKRIEQEWIKPKFDWAVLNLDSACRRCARLMQIDGTTILQSDLSVIGIGARLTAPQPNCFPDSLKRYLETRGNRHNSMACAVAAVENAIGIVVSQDGNAAAFHKPVGRHLEHRELIL